QEGFAAHQHSNAPTLQHSIPLLRVLARLGDEPARNRALAIARDSGKPAELRVAMLQLLGELAQPSSLNGILGLITPREPEPVQLAALGALQSIPQAEISRLLAAYPAMNAGVRSKARDVLLSRKSWALALLSDVHASKYAPIETPVE